MRKPQAITIGPSTLASATEKLLKSQGWNIVDPVSSIEELQEGWNDGTITENIEAILIYDGLYNSKGFSEEKERDMAFENFVALYAQYCFIGIISYNPAIKDRLDKNIRETAYQQDIADENINFYFISSQGFKKSLFSSIKEFTELDTEDSIDSRSIITQHVDSDTQIVDKDKAKAENKKRHEEFKAEYTPEEKSPYFGKVVSMTSSKGGAGKSTVTIATASYLGHFSLQAVAKEQEERALKVIVIDMDVRDGQLGFFIDSVTPNVYRLYQEGITEESLKRVIHKNDDTLKFDAILAAKDPRRSDDIPPEFYRQLIKELKKHYDFIILDTSVNYLDPLLEDVCYPLSDEIVFVTEAIVPSVYSMNRWIKEVTSLQGKTEIDIVIPKEKISIVVNKYLNEGSKSNIRRNELLENSQGIPLVAAIPSLPSVIANAANNRSMETLLEVKGIRDTIRLLAKHLTKDLYKI